MRTQGGALVACLIVVGCSSPDVGGPRAQLAAASASPPTTASAPRPVESAAPSASSAPVAEVPFAPFVASERVQCKSEYASISIPKVSTNLQCTDEWHKCHADIPVTVENCLGVELKIDDVQLERTAVIGERGAGFSFGDSNRWPAVAAGERMTRLAHVEYGGTYLPKLSASGGKAHLMTSGVEGTVDNPAYAAAQKACKACRGEWGDHGMMQMEGCICRSRDGGNICHDGNECETGCVFDHAEKLGGGLGRRVGKCSETVGDFGCVSFIDPGESKLPPRPLSEVESASNTSCAD